MAQDSPRTQYGHPPGGQGKRTPYYQPSRTQDSVPPISSFRNLPD